jgi:hypothetical protein
MLFEYRAYTLRPGNEDAFWDAQQMRGLDPVKRPIMARVVGYFATRTGPVDQIVHLWRYDSYEDWYTRLYSGYGDPAAEPYYRKVRALMVAQESRFLAPAPIPELTPLWGGGNDWRTGDAPIADLAKTPDLLVEQTTHQLTPGSMPAFWAAYRDKGLRAGAKALDGMLGCFSTLVGQQHQVTQFRMHESAAGWAAADKMLRNDEAWRDFLEAVKPLTMSYDTKLMRPAALAAISPLFANAPGRPALAQ